MLIAVSLLLLQDLLDVLSFLVVFMMKEVLFVLFSFRFNETFAILFLRRKRYNPTSRMRSKIPRKLEIKSFCSGIKMR